MGSSSLTTRQRSSSGWVRARMTRAVSPLSRSRCQGLLQAHGHQQGRRLGQERPARAFDNVGVLMSESELDGLLGEVSGPRTCDNMVKMFAEKMAGEGNDPDDLIVQSFKAYDNEGKIDPKMFQHALTTWGDK